MESTPSPLQSVLSAKQKKLIEELSSCVSKAGINLQINPSSWYCNEEIAVDVEHDENGNMVGIGICNETFCIYWTQIDEYLKKGLEENKLIMHNGVSDIECLRMWGINLRDEQLIWDTMLIQHILDSSQKDYSLKAMARRILGIEYPSYEDIVGKRGLKQPRITLDKQPVELTSMYNAMDCYCTYKLYELQQKAIRAV